MSLSERHRWCVKKILEVFEPELESETVQSFIRNEANLNHFTSFFRGDNSGRLFVFYQPVATEGDEGCSEETGPKVLSISDGNEGVMMNKCCYFVRNVQPGVGLDLAKSGDPDLLFGELGDSALGSIEAILSQSYRPMLDTYDNWGKVDDEQKNDFVGEIGSFINNINEALNSFASGLELRSPDPKLYRSLEIKSHRTSLPIESVDHFEALLSEWCNQIESYLNSSTHKSNDDDIGPRGELEYWRGRMQKLTSIMEQLKRQDCKQVIGVLSTITKNTSDPSKQNIVNLLRRWKQIDVNITESANEAKDNVKYLYTLERFIDPLYTGNAETITDTLPALMNSIKMIHTIARYYNTSERMTSLFAKITEQMISNCKMHITGEETIDSLWESDPQELVRKLEACLKLNEAYQEHYRTTKHKLEQSPKGKQFSFNEMQIFGKFDLFCRRVIKLIDMFSTIDQFNSLSMNKLEGMERLIDQFHHIVREFRLKRHDLLDYHNNKFDRDYVEFNVKITDLEAALQQFINQSFENITSIEHSLQLLRKFQSILQRESLKSDLDSKLNIIFQNYGLELDQVQQLYEKEKHDPPIPRNLPPVAGNITWSRHLLKRIEEPMKQFESNQNVLAGKDAKRIIKMYNKVAKTLVAFEYLWYQAWVQSIDQAKAGLQATLIIRHPDDGKLYVNFDQEILQLIREAKCLDRMAIDVPDGARIVLFQEEKFKNYHNELHWALSEYDKVVSKVIPVTAMVLRPHFRDMEYKLRPGMITLTWTSMNIDAYKQHIQMGLRKLEELVVNINDIIENRIEKNLKIVSRTLLVDLPDSDSFTVEDFVKMQEKHIAKQSTLLQGKNLEIEFAVRDLIKTISSYKLDSHVEGIAEDEIVKLKKHYNHFMYQALLHCAKNSMNALKKRIGSRSSSTSEESEDTPKQDVQPFFEVDIQLAAPQVVLHPSLDEIQECINRSAQAILKCFKTVKDWSFESEMSRHKTFFDRVTKDIEIVRVALLLTGCIQGIRNTVQDYLNSFAQYDWLWHSDKDLAYNDFMKATPTLDDYERKLKSFGTVDGNIAEISDVHNIGALSLRTVSIKSQLRSEGNRWKVKFSDNLHVQAKTKLESLTEYIRMTNGKVLREVVDLDTLRFIMTLLVDVRNRESSMDMEITPIMDMYRMLESYLPSGFMEKEEIDKKTVLRTNWKKLLKLAEQRTEELSHAQTRFKRTLLKDIKDFKIDVDNFREDFLRNGPMIDGISANDAVERLSRFKEEYKIRSRKMDSYRGGEDLFALPLTDYPDLGKTEKELKLADQLFSLYVDVLGTLEEWKSILWVDVQDQISDMNERIDGFALRCKKLPARLREYNAYKTLKTQIEDFTTLLPILSELSKESIRDRHWEEIMVITKSEFDFSGPEFKLSSLLEIDVVANQEEIEEVTDGADKQLKIEKGLEEIDEIWTNQSFAFREWKGRNIQILLGTVGIMEELEETQMNLQAFLTMRHVAPFRERAQELLQTLSDSSDTLERWLKVQMMWCSLESVFTGGDIAKQMPMEAKKFSKIDKEWAKVMSKAYETQIVVESCANEVLRAALPVMYQELEKCQKSLEGYLEQKRNKFPRFYFVSNPGLLIILSQGSDPLSMNEHYEKVFDAISYVEHNKKDKTIIEKMHGDGGKGHEVVPFSTPVRAVGNIEDWLVELLRKMQQTMKDVARNCSSDVAQVATDINQLRGFVDNYISQFALLGIQMLWTTDMQVTLEMIRSKKNAMKECNQRQSEILREMSSWCLLDLGTKVNRRKVETLVTIHVHQRDVTSELAALARVKKIHDANDFEWLKQARFYFRTSGGDDVSDDGACVISITDVEFNYQYEYLGAKERLVVTPLTDRCYITLAQALGMFFGGAPAGPAGTGKTESVKDLGRSLGIFVVVTNCTDQQSYKDCAKIFKGLCMAGLWGCFDEFNRIRLPVLSVVAQQVLSILNAKKAGVTSFQFPGDPQNVDLIACCGFFITMNPGYAGRQELPENLKTLFRGVAMMVPDFQMIIKVKLCSVGYDQFEILAQKFFVLYNTSKEQLSAQKHYDWGLRNILAVLRTAGQTKRDNVTLPESFLLYRTLREMNLSKMVAQDVPLFLSLLADLFPQLSPPSKAEYPDLEEALKKSVAANHLIYHPNWVSKVLQLYDVTLVRHGIMLVGPTGGGKTQIFKNLRQTLDQTTGITHKDCRLNPKAIRAQEMYGEVDPMSGEWTTGVFAAMWAKYNNRANTYNMWLIADGPVDAIWIEDLNTVLDDNRILTLANGDRIPMTDNVKIMFEVETLVNASPATVSRAGIIYVSDTDLDWLAYVQGWIATQPPSQQAVLTELMDHYLGNCSPTDVGHTLEFLSRNTHQVMSCSRVGLLTALCDLFKGLTEGKGAIDISTDTAIRIEKIYLYCLFWTVGGLLEAEDRVKFDEYIRKLDRNNCMPVVEAGETLYEYFIDTNGNWSLWRPPKWTYPAGQEKLDFSNLLVPTMDSTRASYNCLHIHKQKKAVCMVGAEGTAKTSTALMFFNELDSETMLVKRVNFSSATTPFMCQSAVEVELEKRGGRNFGPPGGKAMTIFMDDMSMPEVNTWGDQPTLEMVRLIVEYGGFCFLDKDKRGDFKVCEDLQYFAAMQHPGGGKNDIPNRLKRNFFIFNLVLPSITSINDIYGQMLAGRFPKGEFPADTLNVVNNLTDATIELWRTMKDRMLPTPAKFHYIFNLRELSRVFQGILLTPTDTIKTGGYRCESGKTTFTGGGVTLLNIWKHECCRVFSDKLTNLKDKATYSKYMDNQLLKTFGESMSMSCGSPFYMVNFLRPDVYDDEGVMQDEAPKLYEPGGDLMDVRPLVQAFLERYNTEFPSRKMDLVLFNDALEHMLRINRLMEMPRGSGLLVGVGGSGKQSLTRLSSFIARSTNFQITLTKQYNKGAFIEDMKILFKNAGHMLKPTTFLFTESEIKDEVFLEYINSILLTGDLPGLFAKDEMMAITADLRSKFIQQRPHLEDSQDNLKTFFIDKVRDNLHLMLCMSPMNAKFPIRARKFPGLISCPTIDWFLPWPADALVALSQAFIGGFHVECEGPQVKEGLMTHMGMVHSMVTEVCDEYFVKMRRRVYQTPKSYLSFIQNFIKSYSQKLAELKVKEGRVNLGLTKLVQGAQDVEDMKVILAQEQIKLEVATVETNKMLESLEISSAEAKKESDKVSVIKTKCQGDADRIGKEKSQCMADLAKAQPFVDEAETAIRSIKPADIGEVKRFANPATIIQLVFDGILLLFKLPMNPTRAAKLNIAKQDINFIEPSFRPHGVNVMNQADFLKQVVDFGTYGKDKINEETIEFLCCYIELEGFTSAVAKNASKAAEGLCTWVRAMKFYHEASKIVKPKLEALSIAEGNLEAANKALQAAEVRLSACQARLNELQAMFDTQMAEKKRIEDGAMALQRKMTMASQLIGGLEGERIRWTEDSNNFSDTKARLVGDCAVACAFTCYCGPFNQEFRRYLTDDKFITDCQSRNVPVTVGLDVISFSVDVGTIGDWNMQGLPADSLSVQNGILVTKSSRFPLMIDPQGQAINWIKNREATNVPVWGQTTLTDPKLKDKLEFCLGDGLALIVIGVEEEIDPMLDPVLEKQITRKGKRMFVNVSDKIMDYDAKFMMYFITRLPNPNFSPELQAKTTVVDFTVTQKGLEEQLLGKVIGKEQKALEDQLNSVLEDVNANTKALMSLDASLLERLTSNTGNLLEDEELIGVLANTKAKAAEVNQKLSAAADTKLSIAEKREQFRPVATRGSVLYFSVVEMSNVNCMYQTSLSQFLELFLESMDKAEKASLASKRVAFIIDCMTYIVYRYINRGLYEADKLTFVLLVTVKIMITAGSLRSSDLILFLRGGAALDINSVRRKPFNWISNEAWLNVVELSQTLKFFADLPNEMSSNESMWRRWYEDNEPESISIPDYEARISEMKDIGPFYKLLLVRSLRMDRCMLMSRWFVRHTEEMGPRFVEPVTDTIESIYDGMVPITPVIFLLSTGADPTESIEQLARKRKLQSPAVISMGEGQEPVAIKAMQAGAANGTWVLLQNCELGLELMVLMEEFLEKLKEDQDPAFRLFITALPDKNFPLGLLQMSTKVTNEPPAGLKAGVLRSYTVLVDQDRLERVDQGAQQWRQLLFSLCFLHSIVQERRKFGSLGWGIPYEYNNGDLTACILFLEKHLYNGLISWPTFQYMVFEAQYGGKITDNLDRRLFRTYTTCWLNNGTCQEGFSFNPKVPIFKMPNNFVYKVESAEAIAQYHTYIKSFPEIDSPEIFGLHPNADLTFRVKEVNSLFNTLSETQPKGGGGGGDGMSAEDVVFEKAEEIAGRLPQEYQEDDYKAKIQKLGGLSVPLNIFLFQEIQRLQNVLAKVGFMLTQIRLAINGEVVMTEEYQSCIDAIFNAKVPTSWLFTVAGDEFSWILPTLGLWFSSLLLRDDQDREWLNKGRPYVYWLTGFFNPQGMLTAMKQEVCRKHQKDANKWALDDIIYHTEVTQYEKVDHVKSGPAEGCYIHGLFLEGCAWSRDQQLLVESEPKILFVQLPVLMVSANLKTEEARQRKDVYGAHGPYECPCYKYRSRTDRYIIFIVNLKCTHEKNPNFWVLRGVGLLCNTD
jgi:dynein heavy chain, axonemal